MVYLNQRQQLILDYLQQKGSLLVREAQERFQIPIATVYRDFNLLAQSGLAHKVRGGLRMPLEGSLPGQSERCTHCGGSVSSRLAFTIQLEKGERFIACCAHCGLLLLRRNPEAASALCADFLHGNMVNVRQATFLMESEVQPCCAPSVLCFANPQDALRFQKGFGGRVGSYQEAQEEVARLMALIKSA